MGHSQATLTIFLQWNRFFVRFDTCQLLTVFRVNINGFFARKVNYSTPPDLLVKKEPLDDTCKQLTSALEYQLHEIEKQVKNNSKQQQKPVTSNGGHRDGGQSAKFGSSMREMLKSVVSSQKNVLTKQRLTCGRWL